MKQAVDPINLKKIKAFRALSWIIYIIWIGLFFSQKIESLSWLNLLFAFLVWIPYYWIPRQYLNRNAQSEDTLPLWFKKKKYDRIFSILMYGIPLISLAAFIFYQRFLKS